MATVCDECEGKPHADWIIDLGPGAGHDGGRIVFEGTPADLVAKCETLTGEPRGYVDI